MATLNIPARTLPLGPTTFEAALGGVNINTIKAALDFSGWVLPATMDYEIFVSFDNAANWESAEKAVGINAPPWPIFHNPTNTTLPCSIDFGKDANGVPVVVHLTNVRVVLTVTGNPIPMGNSAVTLA